MSPESGHRHRRRSGQVLCKCGAAPALYHISWECPLYQAQRLPALSAVPAPSHVLPACFSHCAIVPVGFSIDKDQLHKLQSSLVSVWQSHIEDWTSSPDVAIVQPEPRFSEVPAPSSHPVARRGHILRPTVSGGMYCAKCGLRTKFIKHIRLEILSKPCRHADLEEDQWLTQPGRMSADSRLNDLLSYLRGSLNNGGHVLTWNRLVGKDPQDRTSYGEIYCFAASACGPGNSGTGPCSGIPPATSTRPTFKHRLGFQLHLPLNAALSISLEPYPLLQRSSLKGSDRQLMMMLTLQSYTNFHLDPVTIPAVVWADLFTLSVVRRKAWLQHKPILLLGSRRVSWSSLKATKRDAHHDLDCHVLCITETHLEAHMSNTYSHSLSNFHCFWSPGASSRHYSGVGILVRKDVCWVAKQVIWPASHPCHPFWLENRPLAVQFWQADSDTSIFACVIYGPSGARWDASKNRCLNSLLDAVAQDVASRGEVPCLLLGDYNHCIRKARSFCVSFAKGDGLIAVPYRHSRDARGCDMSCSRGLTNRPHICEP